MSDPHGSGPPRDLRDLVGEDVGPEELARLRRADAALRSVPSPPATIPDSLTRRVQGVTAATPLWTRRRVGAVLALAATLAAVFFGIGDWTGHPGSFEARATIAMRATGSAPGASALIKVGSENADSGNYPLVLDVKGLRKLPPGGYYVLWLAKDGHYAGTCGTFRVGSSGTASVAMNVSYRLSDYDAWVVTAQLPNQAPGAPHPWLLRAPIRS